MARSTSKKATEPSLSKAKAKVDGDQKRKAAAAPPPRQVRRKVSKPGEEELEPVHHQSHGNTPGEIFVFGDGDCGQLGLGEEITERLRPFPVPIADKKILQIVCGGMHTAVLTQDRVVYSWGVNDEGALGRETTGELWEKSGMCTGHAGDAYTPGLVTFTPGASAIVQLSAGDSHTCALGQDGSVWAWGTFRDASGVFGFSPSTRIQLTPVCVYVPRNAASQMMRIASGADHVAAVTRDGRLLTWGNGQQGQLGRVGERMSDRAKKETLLMPHTVPLKLSRLSKSTKVVDVSCGTYTTFATTADGSIHAWGLNNYGQLGLPGQAPVYSPTVVKSLKMLDVAAVRSGQHHTLVTTKKGELLSFGRPTYGRLGQKDADVSSDAACPDVKTVDGLQGVHVAGAAAGLAVSGCFDADGAAWMWGFGTSNQLGKGEDDDDEIMPKKLAETKKFNAQRVLQLEIGGQHVGLLCCARE